MSIMMGNSSTTVGIDRIAFDVPKIHLDIAILAEQRNIVAEKLIKGLGLQKMTFPDVYQDVVTFAANAVHKLFQQAPLEPTEIDRIYVGTESGIDSSKPVASYVVSLLEQQLGTGVFRHCDVVDLTFACIGAVDAFQNCLDYIRLNPTKKAIVVATDVAKYDLSSSGEYTQGSGAIAMLLTSSPQILAFSGEFGVSTEGVFDFFKPRRTLSKSEVTGHSENAEWHGVLENEISIYKEQPVFDGQYSNTCYINRIVDAYQHYKKVTQQAHVLYQQWTNILMHLPYAYQGRRTFVEIFAADHKTIQIDESRRADQLREITKSQEYVDLVLSKIAPSEIASAEVGNMYTGSIFLGLLSTLCLQLQNNTEIVGAKFGFIAYGSGSKAKVFEGQVQSNWQAAIEKVPLFETLSASHPMDFDTYIRLHTKMQQTSFVAPQQEFVLDRIENENPVLLGARYYKYVS